MKKTIALVVLAVFAAAFMSSCISTKSPTSNSDTSSTTEQTTTEQTTSDTEPESTSETEQTQPQFVINDAVDATKSSKEDPIPLGQWASITTYNTTTKKDEPCFVRITEIVRDKTEIKSRVDEYNAKWSNRLEIEDEFKDLFEYLILKYEIAFPADFPTKDGTIYSCNLMLSPESNESGGFPAADGNSYIGGFRTPIDLNKGREDYPKPGEMWECAAAFEMVNDYEDFYIDLMFGPSDNIVHAAFAIK